MATLVDNDLIQVTFGAEPEAISFRPVDDDLFVNLTDVLKGEQGEPGGNFTTYIAASSISGHKVVVLDSSGQVVLANSSDISHATQIAGVTANAAIAGGNVVVLDSGTLENPGWGLIPGSNLYLGLNGTLEYSPPVGSVFTQIIGRALSSSLIQIQIQPAIMIA